MGEEEPVEELGDEEEEAGEGGESCFFYDDGDEAEGWCDEEEVGPLGIEERHLPEGVDAIEEREVLGNVGPFEAGDLFCCPMGASEDGCCEGEEWVGVVGCDVITERVGE